MADESGPITANYSNLCQLWKKFDHKTALLALCVVDASISQKFVEESHVFELLASLKPKFEPVNNHLLTRDLFPSLFEVYPFLHREEHRRRAIPMRHSLPLLLRSQLSPLS